MLLPPARDPLLDPPIRPAEWRPEPESLRKPRLQAAAVFLIVTFFAWTSLSWPRGPWNLVWMMGIPFLIGFVANRDFVRVAFGLVLVLLSLATMIANELSAHLLFGMCLSD